MELIAEGPRGIRARRRIPEEGTLRLGRAPDADGLRQVTIWALAGDPRLSRTHAEVERRGEFVRVRRLPKGRNPLFFRGSASEVFDLAVGEHFVVGETTFRLVDPEAESPSLPEPDAAAMMSYTFAETRRARYRNADERLEVLTNLHHVIRGANNDEELFSRLVVLLLEGVPSAEAAAIVRLVAREDGDSKIEVCHWDRRDPTGEFHPSRRLVLDALEHQRHSVGTFWGDGTSEDIDPTQYTVSANLDWAFCTPVPGEACADWGLYVAGHSASLSGVGPDLRPDLRFAELMADILGALKDVHHLQERHTTLSRFFSPLALPVLTRPGGEQALEPRETRVSVMFCDLRGFSRAAEEADDLLGLLERVGQALDVMTEAIHIHHGVIGDFQGDAALAFWGWPIDDADTVTAACHAALNIRRKFTETRDADDPLANFRCGLGIATGEAVVGMLGTRRQLKIGVFGPVVNLASRLEGITKHLGVPILIDEATAEQLRSTPGSLRLRRLARVRPYGLHQALTVCELLPALEGAGDQVLDDEHIASYETALDDFGAGRWDEAIERLYALPHWDRGKDFLTSYILQNRRQPPVGWDGVIALDSK